MNRLMLKNAAHDFRKSWKTLFLTNIAYRIIAFVLLAPFVAGTLRALLSLSGRPVLADQDILFFLMGCNQVQNLSKV